MKTINIDSLENVGFTKIENPENLACNLEEIIESNINTCLYRNDVIIRNNSFPGCSRPEKENVLVSKSVCELCKDYKKRL